MANDKFLFVVSAQPAPARTAWSRHCARHTPRSKRPSLPPHALRAPASRRVWTTTTALREQFQQLLETIRWWSTTSINGNYYGTLKSEVEKRLEAGKVVVLVIDVHGAANIRRMFPGATTVFLLPPSVEELEHRLRGRGTETEESIQERLATARQELAEQDKFTVKLVNNQIEPCAAELYQVICQRAGLQE